MIKGLNDKSVKAYYEYMVDVAVIYGADRNLATKELKESLEFELKLANVRFLRKIIENNVSNFDESFCKNSSSM